MRAASFGGLVLVGALLPSACGSRTGLSPGYTSGAAGTGTGGSGAAPEPACITASDCPQPPPERCGVATCTAGVCALSLGQLCDDGNPCTLDSCREGACVFSDGRVDADGDGAFASGNANDPKAALGCGDDCDDSSAEVSPRATERCDGLDNDCNGVVDDGSRLVPWGLSPTLVSPPEAARSSAAGIAFDGESFGVTMTNTFNGRTQGQFQRVSGAGQLQGGPQRIARVNAESYGGPLVWTGARFLTAYEDARQDQNYEIYFNHLNREGQRLIEDLRVTNADDYSLNPSVLWTGAEALLVWDDRRFEGLEEFPLLFGQRVSADGTLLGANVRIFPSEIRAQNAATALGATRVGIAFTGLDSDFASRLSFMTTSRTLEDPSPPVVIPFDDPDGPVVTPLGSSFVITFHQDTGVIGPSIYGVLASQSGALLGDVQSLTAGATHARGNATVSYGDRFVMVWADDRDGTFQLYSQTFDQKLSPITPRERLTTTSSNSLEPFVAATTDGGLGVAYTDEVMGRTQTLFTRLGCEVLTTAPPPR